MEHPNVCCLLDSFENKAYMCVVLPYIHGGDVLKLLELHPYGLGATRAANVISQVVLALLHLHQQHVAFQDVMLSEETDDSHKIV